MARAGCGIRTVWGMLAAATVAGVAWNWSAQAQQYAGNADALGASGGELITHFDTAEGRPTTLTIIDPRTRVIGVYHIDREKGEIQLKSIRNIRWDLQLDVFNSGGLSPTEIQKTLGRK